MKLTWKTCYNIDALANNEDLNYIIYYTNCKNGEIHNEWTKLPRIEKPMTKNEMMEIEKI